MEYKCPPSHTKCSLSLIIASSVYPEILTGIHFESECFDFKLLLSIFSLRALKTFISKSLYCFLKFSIMYLRVCLDSLAVFGKFVSVGLDGLGYDFFAGKVLKFPLKHGCVLVQQVFGKFVLKVRHIVLELLTFVVF